MALFSADSPFRSTRIGVGNRFSMHDPKSSPAPPVMTITRPLSSKRERLSLFNEKILSGLGQ